MLKLDAQHYQQVIKSFYKYHNISLLALFQHNCTQFNAVLTLCYKKGKLE